MSDSFSDWTAKVAEAYCVLHGIPCKRKFTDTELERAKEQVRKELSYADAMIKCDQLTRHAGRPDHDMDTRGNPLKAGS